ncbi:hypothetical protein MPWG_00113 [Micromonas pusilla virus PL1]|jgi:hypothetical protein|nr:hypothetical protein MPWG_00113 [Micromonas pusilla virus PL1]|tara:strand:+ start:3287 stop:3514 length:228 start_codon:yes stop_codon:yes gene_type:complete
MLDYADFNEVYANKPQNVEKIPCEPPACFVGSYAPVAKAGETGPFFVNTYLLQPNRKMEVAGPVPVRSKDLECGK